MSGFMGKILSHFGHEVIVASLSNSKSFQKFALKMDSFLVSKKSQFKEVGEKIADEGIPVDKFNQTVTQGTGFDFQKFATAFKEEVSKDMSKIKTGMK